ncbi:MAG: LPP20 family lipoprotein [Desulfobacterales bacterium]|nr:LPP20 family lipoprotein [Desulfobacterales bacterium]MBF0395921.1 LPP20 family lipoprotein [Desulfobacterales bacterium]
MKRCKILFFIFSIVLVSFSISESAEDLVEQVGSGSINWTDGIIVATGIGAPPEQYYGKPNARPMALQAAKIDALRKMLEVVNGVRINSTTVVKNFAVDNDTVVSEVQGLIKGAKVVNQQYMSDGTVEVKVELNMRDQFAQIMLPDDIKDIPSVTPTEPASNNVSTTPNVLTSGKYTGLVVDARGLKAKPAMSPKILDENKQEVYGSSSVDREYAVKQGLCGYAKDIVSAKKNERVAGSPLVVKGIKVDGAGKSDIIISNADANILKNSSDNASIMQQCRVMIVVD